MQGGRMNMIEKNNHGQVGEVLYVKMKLQTFNEATGNTTYYENLTNLSVEYLNNGNFRVSTSVPIIIDEDAQGDYETVCEHGTEIHEWNE